jgi:trigger factor
MLIELRDLSTVSKEADIEIPAEALREHLSDVSREFARRARIPGFRQGKAPMAVVRKRFGDDIRSEVIERLLPVYFTEAVKEKSIVPIGEPHLVRMGELEDDAPLTFTARFEVLPNVDLKEWKGLEISEPAITVSAEEVDQAIENIRNRASTFSPVEGRAAAKGDWVVIDIESSGEGIETRTTEDYDVELGESEPLPGFVDALVGRMPGEEAVIEKNWEEDAPNEEVRGKTMRYHIRLKSIRTLDRPEVDDDLAKTAGWDTLDQMRDAVEQQIRHHKDHEALNARRKQIGDQLVELHAFDVPEVMVEEELSKALREYARYLASQGVNLEYAEIDWVRIRDEFRAEAEKRVRRMLILEAIADAEEISSSDEDVDQEIRSNVEETEFVAVRKGLRQDGTYESIRRSLRRDKALQRVLDAASVRRAD